MLHRLVLNTALLWLMATSAFAEPDSSAVAWPLDLPTRYLTSNFMEYRPGRFHAGLDLKTRSEMGFAVRAVEDGWILRVRSTPGAYGRAIYLRGESGRTYVYAHLMRYADRIRSRVVAEQERRGSYRARLSFAAGQVPVRKGELLGLSGQSGTGGPHLHFEVRDAKNRPVDPQAEGFAVPDTFAPGFYKIRAIPVGPATVIDGLPVSRSYAAESVALSGRLPELRVAGPVAFSASIMDRSDIRGHRLSPANITLILDGKEVFVSSNVRYDFASNSYQRLEWLQTDGLRERWLHRHPANALPGRRGDLWYLGKDGQGLAPGVHLLELAAVDRAGNRSSVSWKLIVADPAGSVVAAVEEGPQISGWKVDPVRVDVMDPAIGDSLGYLTPFFDVLPEVTADWLVLRLYPDAGDPVLAATTLVVQPATLDSLAIGAARKQGLDPLDSAGDMAGVTYLTANWPIDAAVSVPLPDAWPAAGMSDSRVQLYRWSGDAWSPAGRALPPDSPASGWRFSLSDPGTYFAFRDSTPPILEVPRSPLIVRPAEPSPYPEITLSRWEVFGVGVRDSGSGVDPATLECELDGRLLVVEPDLPRDRVLVELPDQLAQGPHRLKMRISDEVGNQAETVIDLEIP